MKPHFKILLLLSLYTTLQGTTPSEGATDTQASNFQELMAYIDHLSPREQEDWQATWKDDICGFAYTSFFKTSPQQGQGLASTSLTPSQIRFPGLEHLTLLPMYEEGNISLPTDKSLAEIHATDTIKNKLLTIKEGYLDDPTQYKMIKSNARLLAIKNSPNTVLSFYRETKTDNFYVYEYPMSSLPPKPNANNEAVGPKILSLGVLGAVLTITYTAQNRPKNTPKPTKKSGK